MKNRAIVFIASCLVAAMLPCVAARHKASVLYVGGSADCGVLMGMTPDSVKLARSARQRAADFTKFLKSSFSKVKAIDAADYRPSMSDGFDVTVFDGRPPLLDGNHQVLPDSFNRPSVTIADASVAVTRGLGVKNDWYCLCLQDKAMRWKKDHPIFNGPFKADIKTRMYPTPAGAIEFAELFGEQVPDSVEMWTVQKQNYTDDPEIRIGLVCRPWGYDDSPDAEIISGGISSKSIDAVAIGRHGNFFHWGFGVSPSNLTAAGRAVLANAIAYMAELGPRRIIARKDRDEIATRHSVTHAKGSIARASWEAENHARMGFYLKVDSGQRAVKQKIEAGQKLTKADSVYMSIPPQRRPKPTPYADFIRQREPVLFHYFGDDIEEYNRYYDRNTPWFYPSGEGGYQLDIDEDVRSLGIANNDINLIPACISLLKGEKHEAEKGRRILERYTLCRFDTPVEWQNWFDNNRDRLFFTESGGWLWMVDSDDPSEPANDYSVLTKTPAKEQKAEKAPSSKPDAAPMQATDRKNPVAVKAELINDPEGKRSIVITMNIHPGFHTYANIDEADPFIPTEIAISLPEGITADGPMTFPAAEPSKNATTYYKGVCRFIQPISGKAKGEAKCTVSYQSCDNSVCLAPVSKTLTVNID